MLTASKVQTDVYNMFKGSALSSMISGAVYRAGYRPRDSRVEDAIVTFTAGTVGEVEKGVVTVNIYVPDIDPYENGVLVEDGARTDELEQAAAEWVQTLTAEKSDYKFKLSKTIYTEADRDTKQHFVVVILEYEHYR